MWNSVAVMQVLNLFVNIPSPYSGDKILSSILRNRFLPKLNNLTLGSPSPQDEVEASVCSHMHSRFPDLRKLDLQAYRDVGGVRDLANCLRHMNRLESICLPTDCISSARSPISLLRALVDALHDAGTVASCTKLVFRSPDGLTADSSRSFRALLPILPHLQHLDISNGGEVFCADVGILRTLAASLCQLTLLSVGFSSSSWDAHGFGQFLNQVLCSLTGLQHLALVFPPGLVVHTARADHANLQASTNKGDASALATLTQLTSLQLRASGCVFEEVERFQDCISVLRFLTNLDSLDVYGCTFGETKGCADVFAASLAILVNLRSLKLPKVGLWEHRQLQQAVAACAYLTTLWVQDVITEGLVVRAAGVLKQLTSLHSVELWFTRLRVEGSRAVGGALGCLTCLTHVQIVVQAVDPLHKRAAKTLIETVSALPKLRVLNVVGPSVEFSMLVPKSLRGVGALHHV